MFDPIREVLGADTGPSDAHLLDAFARGGEETAFALLVRRHGRLVWSVCRRILRDPLDAEDAFQATFLVLARKASSIRKQSSVGSWLHGVAFRLCSQMRQRLDRRRRRERAASSGPGEPYAERMDPRPEPVQELSLRSESSPSPSLTPKRSRGGSPPARKLLQELAGGAPGARLTRAAAESLQRTGE